jgi:hypothetical protein
MYFRLKCECGNCVIVPEGAAGASLACTCGRRVPVPELTELRQRAASGEISCCLYADGEKPPPPPSPIADATHGAFCWLVLLVGGLIAAVGVLLAVGYGRIGYYAIVFGIVVMGAAARALANRNYSKAARAGERQEFARLTGEADRSVGRPAGEHAETSVTDRPRK